jgi:hypothetical protein
MDFQLGEFLTILGEIGRIHFKIWGIGIVPLKTRYYSIGENKSNWGRSGNPVLILSCQTSSVLNKKTIYFRLLFVLQKEGTSYRRTDHLFCSNPRIQQKNAKKSTKHPK